MNVDIWLLYVLAVLVLTASPGPSSLLCLSRGVTSGWRSAVLTALGSLTAITGILTLSFTGLGVLIASSELMFNVIKWVGAAYLIYLGVISFTSTTTSIDAQENVKSTLVSRWVAYRHGFVVGASNPKAILFFTALFPQFIDPQASLALQYGVLASTFIILELSWLLFYAYLGVRSSQWLFQPGRAKWFNRVSGGVFVGAGAWLSNLSRT